MDMTSSTLGGLPGLELQTIMDYLARYFLASIRLAGFFLAAPFFGARYVPNTVRIMFAMVVTFFIFPRIAIPASDMIVSGPGVLMVMSEAIFGLGCGLILLICFSAVSMAGEKIASTAGLGYAAQIDPASGGQTPVVSQLLTLFLIVLFLSLNGHLLVIGLMLESYTLLPLGEGKDIATLVQGGISAAGYMFFAAAVIMLPVVTLLLMINISIGIITRSAPQLNLFSFGFPISLLGVFVILYFAAPTLGFAMSDLLSEVMGRLENILGDMNG